MEDSVEKNNFYLVLPDPVELEIEFEEFDECDNKDSLIKREKELRDGVKRNKLLLLNEYDNAEHILEWKANFKKNTSSKKGGGDTPPQELNMNNEENKTPIEKQVDPELLTTPIEKQVDPELLTTPIEKQVDPELLTTPKTNIIPDYYKSINISKKIKANYFNYESFTINTQSGGDPDTSEYDYKKWIKVHNKDNKLISISEVINKLNTAKLNFFKLGTFGLDKRKHIKKELLFNVDKEYEKDFKKTHVPWIYIIAINGVITKIGETCAGLNKRIEGYYSGRNIQERGGTGTSSTTNKYVYNTILYTLKEAEKNNTPLDVVELYGYRIKTRECYVNMLKNSYLINLAYTKGIEAIIINWFISTYKTGLLLGINKSPCVSYNDSVSLLENDLFFTPRIVLNTLGRGNIEESKVGPKKRREIQPITPLTNRIRIMEEQKTKKKTTTKGKKRITSKRPPTGNKPQSKQSKAFKNPKQKSPVNEKLLSNLGNTAQRITRAQLRRLQKHN
jgi:hypothetical protein